MAMLPRGWWIVPSALLGAVCWVLLASLAFGQTVSSQSASQSQASQTAIQSSGSIAGAQGGNVTFNTPNNTRETISGTTTVRTAPGVAAPGIITAHNCALGVSAGVSVIGTGVSAGGSIIDDTCRRISEAAAINTLVGKQAAIIHLAGSRPEVCKSLRQAGAIGANSRCGDEPAATVTTRSAAVAPVLADCERKNGKLYVKPKPGVANKDAIAFCKR